ncbi:lymphocyte cytosolic protein 2 isoform X1 [Nycticebus coucang]|uniref:lymphocyte cytosolic protein 2 isoform X1 n=1 Tax=Nycticebus coucang TaxID=9470 RepID=UPI00234C6F9C|nr:lymphocyte cytosolic protein 2 isoform X1 [Nycticebus coucang]
MALRNVPFRSEVLAWDPDSLADYFKKLNYRDCERAVKKYHIDGARFLNLTENDIQKFPKLRVPILSKLSQEINRNEERRSIFTRKPQVQRFPEETGSWALPSPTESEAPGPGPEVSAQLKAILSDLHACERLETISALWLSGRMSPLGRLLGETLEEDNGGWSSFEEDDYESPNDDEDGEDDGDYESPNEEEEAPMADDADYEPPPSNDEEALQSSILPAKPFPNTNSMYIDRPPSGKAPQQPPVPPQRPMAAMPPPPASRNHSPLPLPQPNHEEPSRSRNHKTAKLPPPSIDRSTKPPLDRSLAPFDREPFTLGKKPAFSDKPSIPAGRPLGEPLSKIQKPPLPPTTERHERSSPLPAKKPPVPKHGWGPDRRENVSTKLHQRPLPQPALLPMSSNTFPSRSTKPNPKHSLPSSHMPGVFPESNSGFPQSASLPPYFSQGSSNRPPLRAEGRNFPLPIPNKPPPPSPAEEETSLNEEWYVSYITRTEAEAALRRINQDGTFLVRDSSKKTITNPYVLMVLYKDKVYNIQIRYQEQSQVYLLGTGLRGKEDFLSVSDIIDYFRKMPLLLIDGKNRGSRYQCTLTHAAGYL